MWGSLISYALPLALATALLVAAYTDIRRREIDNELNAAIALAAPLWWLALGYGWWDAGMQVALAAVTFAVACVLFVIRQMGGGDVKLLSALALWFPPGAFLQLVVLMAVIGGGASIAMAAFNMRRAPGERLRDALAMAVAAAWVIGATAMVWSLAMRRPLLDPATILSIRAAMPAVWVAGAGIVAVLAVFALGFAHILRRQKSRLPVPYGVAISAAGLWMLGEYAFRTMQLTGLTG